MLRKLLKKQRRASDLQDQHCSEVDREMLVEFLSLVQALIAPDEPVAELEIEVEAEPPN